MFHEDNSFLIETYENLLKSLNSEIIEFSKNNNSYYNFHLKTDDFIIVPEEINFNFKFLHLIKKHDPVYWSKVVFNWKKKMGDNFVDPTTNESAKNKFLQQVDSIIHTDYYDINPTLIKHDNGLLYYENLEKYSQPIKLTPLKAHFFKTLYEKTFKIDWFGVDIFLFPVNDIKYYGEVNGQIKLIYPIWDAYRWSYEIPKFICDSNHKNKIVKLKQFDISYEQESIRLMNHSIPIECF